MRDRLIIGDATIGVGHPIYCIAEISANHNQNFEEAKKLVRLAKESKADAVKIQTYTPDTITIDCRTDEFLIGKDSLWHDRYLYDLYKEAYTPWEWQPELKEYADALGITLFSTPFDHTAVDFLERMDVPAYKIASFEMVDVPLIKRVARTGKPIIMSTGMATLEEVDEAVSAVLDEGNDQLCLLKCLSAYPAKPEDMNLSSMRLLQERFGCPVGISDHSLGNVAAVTSVALGGSVIEKHFITSRSVPGPDSAFSMEPVEFREMVEMARACWAAIGSPVFGPSESEKASRMHRRSLFVVQDVEKGERFTEGNVRSIRPGHGLHTRHYGEVLGCTASRTIKRGSPLTWDMIDVK